MTVGLEAVGDGFAVGAGLLRLGGEPAIGLLEFESIAAGIEVGDALVFRATPSPRSPLIPVADFQFRRT